MRLGEAALLDAGALLDPLVGGVDVAADLLVGDHALGAVAADAVDAGVGEGPGQPSRSVVTVRGVGYKAGPA